MIFFDSHCHLHDPRIIHTVPDILDRSAGAGVAAMVTCATKEDNFTVTADLSKTYQGVVPGFGIHPWFVDSLSLQWKERLETALLSMPSGVGEIGLDFTDKKTDRDRQVEVFEYQLKLACEMNRPVTIHVRKAWDALFHILKQFGKFDISGLIHSYSGSADMIPALEKYGLFISFSGAITHPDSKKGVQALKVVSPDRFVLETDSPDILPLFLRQKNKVLNEPAHLPAIAEIVARRLGQDLDSFCMKAYENSLILFESILAKNK